MAKCSYVMSVVDNSNPEGVMVAIESSGLGDKIKTAIADRKTSAGAEKGNPILNPYAIRWEHHPDETDFNKRYRAIAMESIAIRPEVYRLITEADPPDVSSLIKPGNPLLLRAVMEKHWCGPDIIDWDEVFADAVAKFEDSDDDPTSFNYGDNDADNDVKSDSAVVDIDSENNSDDTVVEETAESSDEDEKLVECDNPKCLALMLRTDTVCKACGAIYAEDGSYTLPKRRSRRSSVVSKAKSETAKPTESSPKDDWVEVPGDDLPF